jgi:hypothetical protein
MPRKSKFTWNASNTESFQKTIRNFNAKVYYQRKAHPEIADILPDTIKKKDRERMKEALNDDYATQQDFDRQMKSLKRFSRKDATKVVSDVDKNPITNWQKKEIQYKVNTVNQKLAKQRQEVIKTPELMNKGSLQLEELKPIKLDEIKNKNWKQFEKMLDKKLMSRSRERAEEMYKQKYLEKITENLNGAGDELYDFISRVPTKVLYDARFQEDKSLKIMFVSDPTPADQLTEMALNKWRNYLGLEAGETYEDLENAEFLKSLSNTPKGS